MRLNAIAVVLCVDFVITVCRILFGPHKHTRFHVAQIAAHHTKEGAWVHGINVGHSGATELLFILPIAIPVRHAVRPDELDQLAITVNTMGHDIHQMLEAKRALLLAISHELRSPITRARLHAELLPEEGEAAAQRAALLRDLQEMADLVSDLLESERLAGGHAALHREPVDLPTLAREVLQELTARHAQAAQVSRNQVRQMLQSCC